MTTTNSPRPTGFIVLMVALVCVATSFLIATPGFVFLAGSQWQYGETQIGMFVTADSIGNALGPLVLSGLLSRVPVRRTLFTAALAFGVSNLCTALHPAFGATLALRAVSGFSSGVLAGLAMRYLGIHEKAERNLTWLVISQTLYSTLLLAVLLPEIGAAWQATGAFTLLGLLALACAPMARRFMAGEPLTVEHAEGGQANVAGALLGLFALLALNTGVGVVWTFVELQGQAAGLGAETVQRVLGGCNVVSIVGCAAVPGAIRRGGIFRWTIATLLACAAAALVLARPGSAGAFIGGSLLFVVAWATAATLMMTAVPMYDRSGRYVTLIPSALCIGNGVGAAIGGALMEHWSPAHAFAFAAGCCALAAAVFAVLRARAKGDGVGAPQAA
ncbi:MFS transporter [Pelomonas sp. KK5]|uniref:MFS transporter n=1 Tax=Pelomonas sp. KK5 TaxID=1855730 RepID=UPI00097C51AA|nr:MFS transporter [Pelomonas sp. KK5]